MTTRLAATMMAVAGLLMARAQAFAQPNVAPSTEPPQGTIQTSPAQLTDLLAPIALYPDPLLSQILMAASYPVEVVQADRWLSDPRIATLRDGDLAAAVEQQAWDPSVKSLAPFPGILHMMDNHLEWTESLGEAFIANPAAVMDAVQFLRRRALSAGALRSTPQQAVSDSDGIITIEPAAPQAVYYPAYDPVQAFGPWPYPDFPPYAFDDIYDGCEVGDFGYCWFDLAIVAPLWGWDRWDWRGHRIVLDPGRFASLNNNHPPAGGSVWTHERGHRHGVPYEDATARARYPAAAEAQDLGRAARGFDSAVDGPRLPGVAQDEIGRFTTHAPPAFESYGAGAAARAQEARGQSSRMSRQASPPGPCRRPPAGGHADDRRQRANQPQGRHD